MAQGRAHPGAMRVLNPSSRRFDPHPEERTLRASRRMKATGVSASCERMTPAV
jgi:hypothetical protein